MLAQERQRLLAAGRAARAGRGWSAGGTSRRPTRSRRPARWRRVGWRSARFNSPAARARLRRRGPRSPPRPSAVLCGPRRRTWPNSQAAPRSTPLIFSAAMCSRLRAEAARLVLDVDGDRLHPLVEDPHQPGVPAHPDLAGQVLRRHRVVGLLDLDVAVAMHRAAASWKHGKRSGGSGCKCGPLDLGEVLADLAARRAVQARVGHGRSQSRRNRFCSSRLAKRPAPSRRSPGRSRCRARPSPCAAACTAASAGTPSP